MSVTPPYTDQPRPNVIWVMVDQMRGQAMSIAGDPNLRTPNLDRMARDGAWFREALSGCPVCCPARGAFVSGLYPNRCVPGHQYPLDPAIPTIADAFNAAGYHTAWYGKWHLAGFQEREGRTAWMTVPRERRGRFATWVGYENNNAQWDCWVHGHQGAVEVPMHRLPGHETDALTDLLLADIERRRDEPFLMCMSVQPPHDPYSAPAEWTARHNPAMIELRGNVPRIPRIEEQVRRELAGYYALIEHIDHNVGRLMARLDELGLSDHTYVIFFSDHGDQHGSHGLLRKTTPHEESIRIPLLIWGGHRWRYSGAGPLNHPFNHVDLMPTTLGLCGLRADGLPGFDYSPAVGGGPGGRRPLGEVPDSAYLQWVVPVDYHHCVDIPWRGVVTRDGWKYVAAEGQALALFHLREDPLEQHNLAFHVQGRAKRSELNRLTQAWIDRTGDHFTLPDFDEHGRHRSMRDALAHWPRERTAAAR
jgi:arylsulfatase A-like enzyme